MLRKFCLFIIGTGILISLAAGAGLYWLVVVEPGEEISNDNIRRILGKESQVYYSDGETKLGVFFDTAHRQYVTYNEIPANFVNALVASEDDQFFNHIGFDIVGIGRAMMKNIQAGRVVQGGSTLTQQTAKNLFKRTERSIEAKLKELLFALRLEYHYSKEQIFEFYANQFYVSGNGHGLGVAARYYFDKRPEELTLVECAFIAGSVKRPNYYNPFIKKTDEGIKNARLRSQERLKYVLGKMRQLGMIDAFIYSEAVSSEIEFNKGKVGYTLDYAMELVREAVSSSDVLAALEYHGISNIATSGVRVITTVDHDLQRNTLTELRKELSRLDVRLRGFTRQEVQEELALLDYKGDSAIHEGAFVFGTVVSIEGKGEDVIVRVDLDKKLGQGEIDAEGLAHLVTARVKYEGNLWSEPKKEDQSKLVDQLQPGDRAWVRVRTVPPGKPVQLSLEKFPKIQGGAVVLKNGAIKGMAGGAENRFFNRAIQAQRTMGSAFKPLVYTAALQLGWNSADLLRNVRDVFVYHGMPYFPRPDHISPHDWVSMSWAGVHSENVASVWLLSHLCDQLSSIQFRAVAQQLGLAPKIVEGEEESYRTFSARIRDRYGIIVNRDSLREAAYRLAVANVETDFIFDGLLDQFTRLRDLHYGLDFEKFMGVISADLEQNSDELREFEVKELELRKSLLENSFLTLETLRNDLESVRRDIENTLEFDPFEPYAATGKGTLLVDNQSGVFRFQANTSSAAGGQPVDKKRLHSYLQQLDRAGRHGFWQKIVLNGTLTVEAFDKVAAQLEYEEKRLLEELPYSFNVLAQIDDFRITVGLHYLLALTQELGIRSRLEPVLSFPLGSNVVTLLEATRMYEGLVTGKVTVFGGGDEDAGNDSLAILDRIESSDGKILFQPVPAIKTVIDAKTSMAVASILENVVKFGTGRRANDVVKLSAGSGKAGAEIEELQLTVPLLGKTGTANRYTNASFLGYLPGLKENGVAMNVSDGYAIGVYVGFDDNHPMRRRSSRISGSAGALPTWSGLANALIQEQHYADKLDPVDISFYGLGIRWPDLGQVNVAVDADGGGRVIEPVSLVSSAARLTPSITTFGNKSEAGRFVPERYYQPFWLTSAAGQ